MNNAEVLYSSVKNCICDCCCCLPTPMALASGGSPMFPLVVHQPASPSIWPAVQSLRRGLSTNPGYGYLYPTNLSTTLHRRRTMVTQHQSQCQQHGPLSEPALTVTSINIEGMFAAKQQLLAELCEKQKCDVLCVQETHRGVTAIRPNIRGMSLVAEIPHEQCGSAIFVRKELYM